ncbi:ead/Ea22-like family protein [Citrobacter freundii]|uniref:ead/Ea22-like family protein n=1 Tax=Citrobacter freundii TaxID=546 RepID=UPI001F3EF38F|nr:ead/Ea22-like family protein [Citrobacter freundii]
MTALNKQAHKTENERMAQSLAERNGEPVEGLRQRISELEEISTDYGMKFQKAQDALKHQALLHKSQLEAAENNLIDSECHVAELEESLRDKQALLEAAEKRITDYHTVLNNLAAVARRYLPDYDEHPDIQAADDLLESAAGIGVKGE